MKTKNNIQQILDANPRLLTDGGLETTLVFHYEIDLPHFSAFDLLTHKEGRDAIRKYYVPYIKMADRLGTPFIFETPTWRSNTDWGYKLGYSQEQLDEINRMSVRFAREIIASTSNHPENVLISGNIGPRDDGYVTKNLMSAAEAKTYHMPQIQAFAREGADLVSALTINYIDEGIGIIEAAREADIPVVISFTLETDGNLPSGETLQAAIERTDAETNGYATYFMINCAHPTHFTNMLQTNGRWKRRICGIRANASTKSHAELDEAETLDTGDKNFLAEGYNQLNKLLPDLKVIGGCCGTDHSHLEEVCNRLFVTQEVK